MKQYTGLAFCARQYNSCTPDCADAHYIAGNSRYDAATGAFQSTTA